MRSEATTSASGRSSTTEGMARAVPSGMGKAAVSGMVVVVVVTVVVLLLRAVVLRRWRESKRGGRLEGGEDWRNNSRKNG